MKPQIINSTKILRQFCIKHQRAIFLMNGIMMIPLALAGCAGTHLVQGFIFPIFLILTGVGLVACGSDPVAVSTTTATPTPTPTPSCTALGTKGLYYASSSTTLNSFSGGTVTTGQATRLLFTGTPVNNTSYTVNGSGSGTDIIQLDSTLSSTAPQGDGMSNGRLILNLGAEKTILFAYDYIPTFTPGYSSMGTGQKSLVLLPNGSTPFINYGSYFDTEFTFAAASDAVIINPLNSTGLTVHLIRGTHKVGLANGLKFTDLTVTGTSPFVLTHNGNQLLSVYYDAGSTFTADDVTEGYYTNKASTDCP